MTGVVSVGGRPYQWQEGFVDYPKSQGWAHHDVAVLADGRIVTGHPDGRSLLVFRPDGRLLETVATPAIELHGITVVRSAAEERIWVADNGHKRKPAAPEYGEYRVPGRILELTLAGDVAQEIFQPPDAAYEESAWSPCDVAVDSGRAGQGNVWVADGYGASLLHQYSPQGALLLTLDGGSTGRRFQTPHALLIDDRRAEPELYIADRSNRRIVVLSMAGESRRSFGDDVLTSPSGLATDGDLLLVAELDGALAVFDLDDGYLGAVGRSTAERSIAWPNTLDERGVHTRPAHAEKVFNSPHGVTTDLSGGVLVSEWSIGGRVVRLQPL